MVESSRTLVEEPLVLESSAPSAPASFAELMILRSLSRHQKQSTSGKQQRTNPLGRRF
jgi:hypothetical protein